MENIPNNNNSSPHPHVLIFPFPAQGHINSMLNLAELLSLSEISVTFIISQHGHECLIRFTDTEARFRKYPGFRFVQIPDFLPIESASKDNLAYVFDSLKLKSTPLIEELLAETNKLPISCAILDGILGFTADVAYKFGIPVILLRTISACCFWSFFCVPDMIQAGELPIKGEEDMDVIVKKVPGMEAFLRKRDLPSLCRVNDMAEPTLCMTTRETRRTPRAQALIFNTFEDLESPILSEIRNHCPKIYTIGPLHELLKSVKKTRTTNPQELYKSSNSLWEVDRSCLTWLDNQPPQSVLYISFGSITKLTLDELFEFWHGLVNSNVRFLWVIRPGFVTNNDGSVMENFPKEFQDGCKENGYIVKWAPQEEILAHKATGGFLTHSGWNSTLESIVAGVPMICWPYFADQQINSRFVSEVWKLGLDMKDTCDRKLVEKMVNDLMVDKREVYAKSVARLAELARISVNEGGSSYSNFKHLVEEIKVMSVQAYHNSHVGA